MCLLRKFEMDLREIHFPDTVQRIVLSFDQYMFITRDGTVPGRHMAMVKIEIVDGLIMKRFECKAAGPVLSTRRTSARDTSELSSRPEGVSPERRDMALDFQAA
jgi:hypothetical protein